MPTCAVCRKPFEQTNTKTGRPLKKCPACREAGRRYQQKWRDAHPRSTADYQREFSLRRRKEALDAYGGTCDCCGETAWQFLTFDHRDGGGVQHRLEIATRGNGFVSWLHANGFPDFIRLLCHNCNSAIGYYGACPHAA